MLISRYGAQDNSRMFIEREEPTAKCLSAPYRGEKNIHVFLPIYQRSSSKWHRDEQPPNVRHRTSEGTIVSTRPYRKRGYAAFVTRARYVAAGSVSEESRYVCGFSRRRPRAMQQALAPARCRARTVPAGALAARLKMSQYSWL